MAIVYLLSWWYSVGFLKRLNHAVRSIMQIFDYFSIDLLVKTLFSPFRQISSGRVRGGLDIQFRAFIDRLVSRFIGAGVRTVTIFTGLIALVVSVMIQVLLIIVWLILPLLPILGLILALGDWVPWTL